MTRVFCVSKVYPNIKFSECANFKVGIIYGCGAGKSGRDRKDEIAASRDGNAKTRRMEDSSIVIDSLWWISPTQKS